MSQEHRKSTVFRCLQAMAATTAIVAVAGTALAQSKPFEGVTLTVLTFTGPQIAEPLQRRAPEFEELTGAQVNVATVPFSDLFTRLLTDWATGTNSIDAAVFAPQWAVDFIAADLLEDLTDRVAADPDLRADDIGLFFRDFSQQFNGRTYLLTVDGDFQMVYYRTDVLDQLAMDPPETWEDYLAIAKAADGLDMNGDGQGDFGSCIAKKPAAQSYWMLTSVAAQFLQSQGTGQGVFFDTETLDPLFGPNEGFSAALDVYLATTEFGPPDELNLDVGDTRGLFTTGRCALSIDWGDIGTLAIDPDTSSVIDKVGAVVLPGSSRVLDRATGTLVDCDSDTCPFAVNGINHAPFAAFGGWSGGVNRAADQSVKDAAYAFFSYMSQPEQSNVDVTIGITGFNPYRISQFENLDAWIEAGMSEAAAENYLGAIQASLNSPNMVLDLRVPSNQRYQQIVLDREISRVLAGQISKEEGMQNIFDGWQEITDELGREQQLELYLASLGIKR